MVKTSVARDTKLAERVIEAYSSGLDGLNAEECRDLNIADAQCATLQDVLKRGPEGEVTVDERTKLAASGFSDDFITTLAGDDGKNALHNRVKWLANHAVTRWWRRDYNKSSREYLCRELMEDQVAATPALPSLIEILTGEDNLCRDETIRLLGYIGRAAAVAVPSLVLILMSEELNVYTRGDAAMALAKIDPAATLPLLIDIISNKKSCIPAPYGIDGLFRCPRRKGVGQDVYVEMKIAVANALAIIGTMAVPALIAALGDSSPAVRRSVAAALGRVGKSAKIAIPHLLNIEVNDPDPKCRAAAKEAREKIEAEIL